MEAHPLAPPLGAPPALARHLPGPLARQLWQRNHRPHLRAGAALARARTPSLAQKPPHAPPINPPHPAAQILVPLDFRAFVFSRLWRILESLEKHSGVSSCKFNLAHASQRWLPYSQMPHHHDWHHEGAKACNFTFTPLGGLWDCLFGTRKAGRALIRDPPAATAYDRANAGRQRQRAHPLRSKIWSHPAMSLAPVVAVLAATAAKLCATSR